MGRKSIDIVLPVYNEKENIHAICNQILSIFDSALGAYKCHILIIDNCSTDGTRNILEEMCAHERRIKVIFNSRNFGPIRSPYYGIISSHADCVIQMAADFQDPPELLPQFVSEWEKGTKVVMAVKKTSKENRLMYFMRSQYYRLLKKIADVEHIEHFTGYGLYDKCVVNTLREMDDPYPYLRGIISEIGFSRTEIPFEQPKRAGGRTKTNFYSLYDYAMLGITSYSKVLMRLATIIGFGVSIISVVIALVYLILKLLFWDTFPMGSAPILIGVFFIGALQLFFIGLLGEYILNINTRVLKRPLVIEERRINFEDPPVETDDEGM